MKGPSRAISNYRWSNTGMIQSGMWREVGGGESGFATPDPVNPDIVWSSASGSGSLGGIVTRYNEKTKQYRQLEVWPEYAGGSYASLLKYRFQWTFPLLISPHDNKTVYVTSQHVHKTTNDGQTWEVISPDLTRIDKTKLVSSGGPITQDNTAVEYYATLFAVDESPIQEGLICVGSDDGLIHLTKDGGTSWENVTPKKMPEWMMINSIDASSFDAGTAYIA